jgi:hypothetical protein
MVPFQPAFTETYYIGPAKPAMARSVGAVLFGGAGPEAHPLHHRSPLVAYVVPSPSGPRHWGHELFWG